MNVSKFLTVKNVMKLISQLVKSVIKDIYCNLTNVNFVKIKVAQM